jgi:DNA sulfur modification protein DndD
MTECYKKLANKKNLVNCIEMDPETLDLTYLNKDGDVVSKERLSAGEKQLMVISLLWSLAICSKKKLPVIIDTPLSRLDSAHRESLITTYFPHASEQTIILSTDSEIDERYYELMQDNVGDRFTLEYDDNEKTTSLTKTYFGWE